jgi:hypothetical protein
MKMSALVALMGKMSRGRRGGDPSFERDSNRWRHAALGSFRATAEKFGHSTWRNATGSSLDLRDPLGPSVPVASSEAGAANSNCWIVRA